MLDTLAMARKKHPGQKNNLDALCKRYGIDNSHRELHGALLDAEILADVYLLLSGGQTTFKLDSEEAGGEVGASGIRRITTERAPLKVIKSNEEEDGAHAAYLNNMEKGAERVIWNS